MKTAFDHFRRCVELCQRHGHGRIEVSNHYMVAWTQIYQCEVLPALEGALAACEAASRVAHRRAEMVARLTAGRAHYERRELADAKRHLEIGLRLADELGAARFEAFFLIYLSRITGFEDGDNTRA